MRFNCTFLISPNFRFRFYISFKYICYFSAANALAILAIASRMLSSLVA